MGRILCDPRAAAVLAHLRGLASRQSEEMQRYYDTKRRTGAGPTDPRSVTDMNFVRDKLVALNSEKCDLCYLLCRALRAEARRRIWHVVRGFHDLSRGCRARQSARFRRSGNGDRHGDRARQGRGSAEKSFRCRACRLRPTCASATQPRP